MSVKGTVWRRSAARLPQATSLRMRRTGGLAPKRAALFARVASSFSPFNALTSQLAACQRFADQNQLVVVKRYNHIGAGMRGPRPDLATLMADAEQGLFDVLVVTSQDRLSRDASRLAASIEMFASLGVEVQTVGEGGRIDRVPIAARPIQTSERAGRKWRKQND